MYAHTNRILATGSDEVLSRIKMVTYLELHNKCLLPALLYNSETWIHSTKEIKNLDRLQIKALQRYMKTPNSTPILAYYADLGIYPLLTLIQIRQLMYLHKLLNSKGRPLEALRTEIGNMEARPPSRNPNQLSWYNHITSILSQHGLPTDLATIENTPRGRWKTMVGKAVKGHFDTRFYKEAATSTKMTGIITHKQTPTLEKYVTALSRKKACTVFRLRSKTTRAEANQSRGNTLPICSRCNNGLATDLHFFTECPATEKERTKHNISGLDELYQLNPNTTTLERYADFALEIGLVADI
jgi:hypothetical protein